MLAHEDHISSLRIGKYMIAHIIGIGILKSAGDRQKNTGQECFRHLKFVLFLVHKYLSPFHILLYYSGLREMRKYPFSAGS